MDILSGDMPKGIKIQTKHLEALIELHIMTGIFARNIQHLFSESDLRILMDTMKAVYSPYESYKQRWNYKPNEICCFNFLLNVVKRVTKAYSCCWPKYVKVFVPLGFSIGVFLCLDTEVCLGWHYRFNFRYKWETKRIVIPEIIMNMSKAHGQWLKNVNCCHI